MAWADCTGGGSHRRRMGWEDRTGGRIDRIGRTRLVIVASICMVDASSEGAAVRALATGSPQRDVWLSPFPRLSWPWLHGSSDIGRVLGISVE